MGRISKFFGNPGSRPPIHHQAPLIEHDEELINKLPLRKDPTTTNLKSSRETLVGEQIDEIKSDHSSLSDTSTNVDLAEVNLEQSGDISTNVSFTGLHKSITDRTLDKLVDWAGTFAMFILMWIILIIWVVIGIVYNAPFNWQVVMQDGQSIQCYFWDTLLTRQQLTTTHEQILMCAQIRSRLKTFKRFLTSDKTYNPSNDDDENQGFEEKIVDSNINNEIEQNSMNKKKNQIETDAFTIETINGDLPIENWYDKICTYASNLLGSVPSMILFWIGVFVWIGCGALPQGGKKFSDDWQMEINTAVAVSLLISSFFLQNIRARHDHFISRFLVKISNIDSKIDLILRSYYNDHQTENPVITIQPGKRTRAEHVIDWYADVVGTGIGVVVAICVFATWIGIGSPLNYSDSWWLIIGTYTGLVGFLDGFVIRQVYFRIIQHEEKNYDLITDEDMELFQILNVNVPEEYYVKVPHKKTLNYKISNFVNTICSTQWSVLASILIIVGLICTSSGMLWSTTGQLIANTPTMIIEEFFMIVLIQAHNWADKQKRIEIHSLLARRHIMLKYVEGRYLVTAK